MFARVGSGRQGLPPRPRRSRLARAARGSRAVVGTRAPLLRARLLQRHRERLAESEGDVSRTRSPVDRNLERDDEDGAFAGRTDGARAGVSGDSRAGDMSNARVTHHLQQLIVVVLRHRHDARTE